MHFHSPHQGRNLIPSCTPRYQLYARHARPLPKCGRSAASQLRYLMRVELFMLSKRKTDSLAYSAARFVDCTTTRTSVRISVSAVLVVIRYRWLCYNSITRAAKLRG